MEDKKKELPIVVFDSGVGGVSVLKEMVRVLPGEDFFYFGDSANAPYGTKPLKQIQNLTMNHVNRLYQRGMKALVVACNTATSAAISLLRATYTDIPVIGIEPALKPAVLLKPHPHVLVLATPGTVTGEKFLRLLRGYETLADVTALGCPGLMEFVEKGELEGPRLHAYLEELLKPYREQPLDAVVLGCTHYPFLKEAMKCHLKEGVKLLDGSAGTARELRRRLSSEELLRFRKEGGTVTFEMSLPEKEILCRELLEK